MAMKEDKRLHIGKQGDLYKFSFTTRDGVIKGQITISAKYMEAAGVRELHL